MKNVLLILLSIGFTVFVVSGKDPCKVLKPEISLNYSGECKDGLAHGRGEATGIDFYKGMFRKGLPHGVGTYEWSTGEFYEGSWKNGLRHGQGTYYFFSPAGNDTLVTGKWVKDKFVERKKEDPEYKIIYKYNIGRINVIRTGDGEQIWLKILRNGAVVAVSNLMLIGDSGNTRIEGYFTGFERCSFPFAGKITFQVPNDFSAVILSVELQFEVYKPGRYEVHISL